MPVPCPNEDAQLVEPLAIPYITPNFGGWFEVCPCGYVFGRHPPKKMESNVMDAPRIVTVNGFEVDDQYRGCWTAANCDRESE